MPVFVRDRGSEKSILQRALGMAYHVANVFDFATPKNFFRAARSQTPAWPSQCPNRGGHSKHTRQNA
eukprot:11203247-Lingulodinium_polyedra.AAC.1